MPKITVNFTPGDPVKQRHGTITGIVKATRLREEDGQPQYLVEYKDPETGDNDEREFDDTQIEAS